MNRILKYDAFKIKKSKYWWICMLISACLVTLAVVLVANVNSVDPTATSRGLSSYKRMIFGANIVLFLIILSIFIAEDFKNGTIKNIASKGISRKNIAISKIIGVLIFATMFVFVNVISGIVSAILIDSKFVLSSSDMTNLLKYTALNLLQVYTYSCIFTFVAFLVKSAGSSIAIGFGLQSVIPLIFNLIDAFVIKSESMNISNILPSFLVQLMSQNTDNLAQITTKSGSLTIYIVAMLIEMIVFGVLSIFIFTKRDIK